MAKRLTIVQVSDTHLSRSHAWFTANWPVFVQDMRELSPDVIINSGDISFNGLTGPTILPSRQTATDSFLLRGLLSPAITTSARRPAPRDSTSRLTIADWPPGGPMSAPPGG